MTTEMVESNIDLARRALRLQPTSTLLQMVADLLIQGAAAMDAAAARSGFTSFAARATEARETLVKIRAKITETLAEELDEIESGDWA